MTQAELEKLSKKELVDRCWAAEVNADEAAYSASEAWAEVAALLAILEHDKLTEAVQKYIRLKAHRTHALECRMGSCEHEVNALIRRGLASPTVGRTREKATSGPPKARADQR